MDAAVIETSETEDEDELAQALASSDDCELMKSECHVLFNIRKQQHAFKNIKDHSYYLFWFGSKLNYVGKVNSSTKDNIQVKLMQRKPGDIYDWPTTDQIESIKRSQFLCGPIQIQSGLPFKSKGPSIQVRLP